MLILVRIRSTKYKRHAIDLSVYRSLLERKSNIKLIQWVIFLANDIHCLIYISGPIEHISGHANLSIRTALNLDYPNDIGVILLVLQLHSTTPPATDMCARFVARTRGLSRSAALSTMSWRRTSQPVCRAPGHHAFDRPRQLLKSIYSV